MEQQCCMSALGFFLPSMPDAACLSVLKDAFRAFCRTVVFFKGQVIVVFLGKWVKNKTRKQ